MEQSPRETDLVAGRYRVRRELARGGVGAVYEALDESTGKRVALKRLLHDPAEKPRLAMLFEAEYDTLARLSHPRIVEVFDYGIDKQGPYFTMELLDGQDLGELEPIGYIDACRYLRDVASSLALLHTRRRLHRDLSPRNVRLTSDGRCRLLDFGTMASFGVAEDIVGTPPLVPPEALRGTALDHRADLYSLGALAYRVLTGRYPYRARQLEDLPELWRTPPVRLRELMPELPLELDELVMSMLSLDPAFRPNTTYEVIDRLTAVAALPPDDDRGLAAQGYLVGSRLIGRTRQMESIKRHIARAHREHGSTLLIEGNPGVGKSRLLDEAALQAQLSGALTVRVDARAHRGDYAVANALVRAIVEAAPHDARDTATPYAATLRPVFTALTGVLAEATPPHGYAYPTQQQLHTALLSWLFDLSEDRTLVLLVDDLPRVDESSAALLSALVQEAPSHRILIVAARRLADKATAPAGVEAIVSQARRLRLHRLRRENTLALIQSLFGAVPNVELLANWIHDVSTGSPTQIMELARHIVQKNIVRFVDGLWVLPPTIPQDELPRNLAATLSARAAALPKQERTLAEALCVRRSTLPLPLCMKLADEKDVRVLFRNLDELVAKGVLVSGTNGYHFGQDALREVLLSELPARRARLLHLRLGEALLQVGSERPEDTIEAGYNLLLGGAEVRGADLLAAAAGKLPRRGLTTSTALPALEAALELYEKWGRSPYDCLRLRAVLIASMDQRVVAQYGDSTLSALCRYAGGDDARRMRPYLGSTLAFVAGYSTAGVRLWLTPKPQRGPGPHAALEWFYRAAFGVLSVRTSVLDIAGTERLAIQADSLASASAVGPMMAQTFHALLLALRGNIAGALGSGQRVLAQMKARSGQLKSRGPSVQGGVLASVYIGLGMIEAQYALHSRRTMAIIDELQQLIDDAHVVEPLNLSAPYTASMTAPELGLVVDQLRLAHHLARGERSLADARRGELLRTSVQTGLQHQFEVWRNLLECNMSLRTMDVAGLRRCVEIFTHYVAEHSELSPWLEIARAHLAYCLGKPQEALAGYEKWVALIAPGDMMSWDALCFGYADALLAAGEAERARTWLTTLLEHPVLVAAKDSTCWVTLEATLALAEAECQDAAAASVRLSRLWDRLDDADQPLTLGFVCEARARVAHRQHAEATCGEQLQAMKYWYGATRNAALLMRGGRVVESLREPRPSGDRPTPESGRTLITRVTSRRELGTIDGMIEPGAGAAASVGTAAGACAAGAGQKERCEHALHVLVASAGGTHGYLYLPGDDGLQLAAATLPETNDNLERVVHDVLQQAQGHQQSLEATTAPLSVSEADTDGNQFGLFVLTNPMQRDALGAVLIGSSIEPVKAVATELLQSVAASLLRTVPESTP